MELAWSGDLEELFAEGPAAVLTTTRADGTALTSPVWVRAHDGHVEVVIAAADGKARNLRRDPQCTIVVFGTRPPFTGVEFRGEATLVQGGAAAAARGEVAARYLGDDIGRRFADARADLPSLLLRLPFSAARTWDLTTMLEAIDG